MAVLVAHFDDSGSDDHAPHFVVGGFLGRVEEVAQLSEIWDRVVRSWGLEWFHMVDAETMRGEGPDKRNAYGWDWQLRDARIRILGELADSFVGMGVACSLDRALWEKHVKPQFRRSALADRVFGYPYLMPYTGCLLTVRALAERAGIPLADVEIVFAMQKHDGPKARETVRAVHENFGLRDPRFDCPQRLPPLQCADVFAWLANLSVRSGPTFKPYPRHEKFLALMPAGLALDGQWLPMFGEMLDASASAQGPIDPAVLKEIMRRWQARGASGDAPDNA